MKKLLLATLLSIAVINASAKKFLFNLKNTTNHALQVSVQILKNVEKGNPEFLFVLKPNEEKEIGYSLKSGEQIKFIGLGGGVETLPIVKKFENLSTKVKNEYELVQPVLDKLNVLELNDAISKLKNDNVLKVLLDSNKYVRDELPQLGTFIFINKKDNAVLALTPSYWKNESLVRSINQQFYKTINYINSSNAGNLGSSGVPFLKNLSTSFSNSNVMEIVWDIHNAHIAQWQPHDKNVYQILQDQANDAFLKSCVSEMNNKSLSGGDYQLLFISSAYVVDRINVSGRKYNTINFDANMDFQIPPTGTEVVQPIGIDASYRYTRTKTYANVDSSTNVYLKFLSQDYTPALNSYLTQQDRTSKRSAASAKITSLQTAISQQYTALKEQDNTLISTASMDVIIPIALATTELQLKPMLFDQNNINITPQAETDYNKKAQTFNAILESLKDNINIYKLTLESIDKLAQQSQTDYQKVNTLTTQVEVDQKIIDAYKNRR